MQECFGFFLFLIFRSEFPSEFRNVGFQKKLWCETHATNGASFRPAFPMISVRETYVCGWNAVPCNLPSKALFLLPFGNFISPYFLCIRFAWKSSRREYLDFRIHFISYKVLLSFLLPSRCFGSAFGLLPCCAFIIAWIFHLSIVLLKKILSFCNFFSLRQNAVVLS